MSNSKYSQYADGELHQITAEHPASVRAAIYLYARRHGLKAKAYVDGAVVVFRLGAGELEDLPNAPKRGAAPRNV